MVLNWRELLNEGLLNRNDHCILFLIDLIKKTVHTDRWFSTLLEVALKLRYSTVQNVNLQ